MSDEIFRKLRDGYMIKRAEIEKDLTDQGGVFWNEIVSHRFCFDRRKKKNNFTRKIFWRSSFISSPGDRTNEKVRT